MRGLIGGWTLLLLCSCGERDGQQQGSVAFPGETASVEATAPGTALSPAAQASSTPVGLALPARFTALGTEPFWAAKVDGTRLTYTTPEDQVGQPIAVSRTSQGDGVELAGTLAGKRLTLTVSAGPCSDGMSDTVYPFTVRRRLGDDDQRGCARSAGPLAE